MEYEIRAMSFGEILDTGFRLLRNHFVMLLGIGLVICVPTAFFEGYIASSGNPSVIAVILASLVLMVLSLVVSATITFALGEIYVGRAVEILSAYKFSFSVLLPMMGTFLLAGLAMCLGLLLLIIPGLYLMLAYMLVSQVVVLEGVYGMNTLRRSHELMKGSFLRAIGIFLLVIVIGQVLGGAVEYALGFIPFFGSIGSALVQSVLLAFSTAVFVVFYFEIRCRKEAFDLEHLARRVEHEGHPAATSG